MVKLLIELSDKANAIVTYTKTKNGLASKSEAVNKLVEDAGMVE